MYAYFAGGCFWCITPTFKNLDGVIEVKAGYCGGDEVNPKYEDVKTQKTNHRETIRIEYDESRVSFEILLKVFLESVDIHDGGGQYIDRGRSYTLAVYYQNDKEKEQAKSALAKFKEPVFVSVEKYKEFYLAEEYHQDYYLKHPKEFEEELVFSGRKKDENK